MRIKQVLIAVDQVFNTLCAGYADETLSARAWRMQGVKKRWSIARWMIDGLFFWQKAHCYQSYLSEIKRRHLPSSYQNRDG